jgi:hypothetical protein
VVLLVAFEGVVRLVWEPPPRPKELDLEMVPHPTRLWALNRNETRYPVNDEQLRAVADTGAAYRAFTLGDSSIFGHGLDDADTLHIQLGQALAARGTPTDVFCGGVPGYSTEQSKVVLNEVGWGLDPDLLMVGNLWSDNNFDNFVDAEWMAELNLPSRKVDYALLRFQSWQLLRQARHPDIPTGGLPVGWIRDATEPEHGRRRVPLVDYAANLDNILADAADRGVGVVMLMPCNRERLRMDGRGVAAWDIYFETMREVGERRSVLVVDACDALRPTELRGDDAFLDSMHPTGATNALYAEALAEALVAAGWPERPVPDAAPARLTK